VPQHSAGPRRSTRPASSPSRSSDRSPRARVRGALTALTVTLMLAAGLLAVPSVVPTAGSWFTDSSTSTVSDPSLVEAAHRHRRQAQTGTAAASPSGSTGTSSGSTETSSGTSTGTTGTSSSGTSTGTSGATSSGAASSGATSSGATSSAKSSGTTPSGTTSSGTTSSGSTSSGTTSSSSGTSTGTSSTRPVIPYGSTSFLQRPLPASTPVSADNARLLDFARTHNPDAYLKIRGANGVGWGIAFAEASCSDPVYKIGSGGNLPPGQEHLRTVGFHAPASVWKNIPANSDAPFLVVDRCGTSARPAGLSVWGANASVSGSTVTTSAAGSFSHDSNGLDSRNPQSNSKLNGRSRGVIPDSMAIRLDALAAAIRSGTGLGYVFEVFWPETDSSAGFASPMIGAENSKTGVGAEGQRFRIKPGIDLASRPGCSAATNPVGLAIARTLQQNGAYIGDNSGSGAGVKTEQNANYPGLNADSLRGCMTWDDVEFLPLGWTG
jgi:hypothetical protein